MSWFTDLAGKAESLLEKVDTAAASALTKDQGNNENLGQLNRAVATATVPTSTHVVTRGITMSTPYSNQGLDIPRTASESIVLGRWR